MSWPELVRLVADAEADPALRRALRQCRTPGQLLLMARGWATASPAWICCRPRLRTCWRSGYWRLPQVGEVACWLWLTR